MHRLSFSFLVSYLVFVCCDSLALQAQTSIPAEADHFKQELQATNSIATFAISLSPTNADVGEQVTLAIRVAVVRGWHIGAISAAPNGIGFQTQLQFLPVGLEPLDQDFTSSAEPQKLVLPVGTQLVMAGEFTWSRRYRVTTRGSNYSGTGTIRFQACNDSKCLPPQSVTFALGTTQPTKQPQMSAESMPEIADVAANVHEIKVGEPMVIRLEASDLTRPRPQIGNILALFFVGRGTDKMAWKGTILSGPNQGVNIYLPKAKKYTLKNSGTDGTIVSNTATYVSIDQNGDGKLAEWEAAAVDRPIRIRDTMYRVVAIDSQAKTLTLQQLDMPLKGSLIGFRCPDFEFEAMDGSIVSNKSILGKTTVLDIWAVTCHNCYEGFPKLQNCIDKHTAEKLQVILLTVDTNREFYESQAPQLFKTYGGGNWSQVMIPGGFDGALTIGDYGFGSVVIDSSGVVRAVGVHGFNIEATIDDALK